MNKKLLRIVDKLIRKLDLYMTDAWALATLEASRQNSKLSVRQRQTADRLLKIIQAYPQVRTLIRDRMRRKRAR